MIAHPLDFRVYVTSRCNSRCKYCYRGLGLTGPTVDRHTDLPVRNIFRLLDISPEKIESVKLTGGEPAFHPNISEIVNGLHERKYFIELYSNGALTQLSDSTLDQVTKFNLSLDSIDPNINDDIRDHRDSSKSFFAAMDRLKTIGKELIEVQITLSKSMLPTLDKTIAYLIEVLGVGRIKISDLVEETVGQHRGLRLDQEQLDQAHQIVERARERYHFTKVLRTTFFDRKHYLRLHNNIGHLRSAFLNQRSDLYYFIGEDDRFHTGNIDLEDPLTVWSRFINIESRAERLMDHAFEEMRRSNQHYVTPTEFLYTKTVLDRFDSVQ